MPVENVGYVTCVDKLRDFGVTLKHVSKLDVASTFCSLDYSWTKPVEQTHRVTMHQLQQKQTSSKPALYLQHPPLNTMYHEI